MQLPQTFCLGLWLHVLVAYFSGYLDNLNPIKSRITFVNIYNKNDRSFLRVVLLVSYYYIMIFKRFGNKSM